jgi:hypothetical protein
LIVVISAGASWWTGQASGTPYDGPPTKLNLYSIPPDYTAWSNYVDADDNYFVLYVPFNVNVLIADNATFGQPYQGVNGGIFALNDLPYVSIFNTTILLNELVNGNLNESNLQVGESWGNKSVKYIVVYTNIDGTNTISQILSQQTGIEEIVKTQNVVVYENTYAKPIIHTDESSVSIEIIYHDPVTYKVQSNSTDSYTLVLNQAYSTGWTASVNGTKLPSPVETNNGFNSWYINYTGNVTIELYYEPQKTYVISMIISSATIIMIVAYQVASVLKKRLLKK